MLRVDPAADRATDDLAERVGVAGAVLRGLRERLDDLRQHVVEDRLVLGEPARLDLRADDDPAGLRVDRDEDRDEALLGEDAAVLEVGIRDLADARAVDVDEAEVELADDRRDAVRRSMTVPSSAMIVFSAGTPVWIARFALATRWRYSPCTGSTFFGFRML